MKKSQKIIGFIGLIIIGVSVIILSDGFIRYFIIPNIPHTTSAYTWSVLANSFITILMMYKLSYSWLKLLDVFYV